ncbi:MAG TPA: DUF2934 domain-containing protein [Chthoniobacterales bacterium]|nr:DUF2934 domain-containing protein [Chthoniobacterales bacterium]
MPRRPKTSVENKTSDDAALQSSNGKANAAASKKKARGTAAPAKKKKTDTQKKAAAKSSISPDSKPATEPTDEQIRLRAYFLAELRHKLSLPGDSNHDWIEARRQLIEEAGR